jgi:PIN domain nuclease of toxin-antitoxin system
MNKKQLLVLSAISALIVSGFGAVSVLAANNTNSSSSLNRVEQVQKMFGITLTDEQKTQIQTKQTEMEATRAAELAKWQSMDLATWKQQQIDKINATTQTEFDKTKTREVNMLQNGKGFGHGPQKGMEKPAE